MQLLKDLRQHLLTGVSHAIPFIAAGGILIALSLAFAPIGPKGPNMDLIDPAWLQSTLKLTLKIGEVAFTLMLPILAAYIAYSAAGKPGLTPGAIGGFLCSTVGAGFLGAIFAGLIAGYFVKFLKGIPTHKFIKPIMPILIIPVLSSIVVGVLMLNIVGPPIASLMASLAHTLESMQAGSSILLAMVLGAMIAFDMGGPVNKAAFFFASGLIAQGNTSMMGPVAAAICIPPLGLGLATLISRKSWTEEQRESGIAALGMGTIGITEGAIPFAAADPIRIIPCIMLGSMVGSTIAMLAQVRDHAPHGGLIVLPVIDNRIMYVVAIAAGVLVTALTTNAVRKFVKAPGEPTPA